MEFKIPSFLLLDIYVYYAIFTKNCIEEHIMAKFNFWAVIGDPKHTQKTWFKQFTIPHKPSIGEHVFIMDNRKVRGIYYFPADKTGHMADAHPAICLVTFGNQKDGWGWCFEFDAQWEDEGWTNENPVQSKFATFDA